MTTVTLDYTGTRRWYRVPSTVTNVDVSYQMSGGGGAGGGADDTYGGNGGGASVARGTLRLKGGDLLEVFVGEGGKKGVTAGNRAGGNGGGSLSGYNGGRGGYAGPAGWSGSGGGGGGATVIRVNGNVVAVGGGGAGGGGGGNHSDGQHAKNTEGSVNTGAQFLLPRQSLGRDWVSFLETYGVWHADGSDSGVSEFYVYFPETRQYTFQVSVDNTGYIVIDGNTIITHTDWWRTSSVTTQIGAGWRKLSFYADNWGGPRAFAGRITNSSTGAEIWTTRYSTLPAYSTNGLNGGDHGGDGGGGGAGGGGYQGGGGGPQGPGDNGGSPGSIGRALGDTKVYGAYTNQRFSSWGYTNGDGGIGATPYNNNATDGVHGLAVLSFKISNRDLWNKINGSWRNTTNVFTKVNDQWRNVKDVFVKVDGVWKQTFTKGGEIVPSFNSDSVDWNANPIPSVAPGPVTITRSSFIAGVVSGGCGPAIAHGTLSTIGGTRAFAGRAPVLKEFTPYASLSSKPTKNIVFRGANVTDEHLKSYGVWGDYSEVSVVSAGQRLEWNFDVWVDHGWTFGFYIGKNGVIDVEYHDIFTADYRAGGRQHPVSSGEFIIPQSFDANSVLICAFGDRRTSCPTGLHNCYINVSLKTYI